jgi:asparagine synthase (glutamine-hydrolysing)
MLEDPGTLARMLTLRYDPTKKPLRKPLMPSDFEPQYSDQDFECKITNLIQEDLIHAYKRSKFRRTTLSISGGIDSRLTLAMVRQFLPNVKVTCVSVGFGGHEDEVDKAKEFARFYDCDFHELRVENVLTELPMLISIVREPRWNLYHYYAFKYGKRKSDVFFTGDGGDELFGGYTFRYHKFMSLYSKGANWRDKAKLYLSCHERDWVPDQEKMFGKAINFSWESIYRLIKPHFQNGLDPLDQVFLADFNGKLLFDWLPTNEAFGGHLGIEIRSVFLANRIIEFAFHLPWEKKYDPRTQIGKLPLRSILKRQKGIIDEVDVRKTGFSVDLDYMWNKNAREITTKYLNPESDIVKNKLIDPTWLMASLLSLRENSREFNLRYVNKMLSLLALEVWYRLFVSHSMKSREKL